MNKEEKINHLKSLIESPEKFKALLSYLFLNSLESMEESLVDELIQIVGDINE